MQFKRLAGFLPSRNGFHFPNQLGGNYPVVWIANLPIAWQASGNGLCGGFVFAALDCFLAGQPTPATGSIPAPDTPLWTYVADRLVDSLNNSGWWGNSNGNKVVEFITSSDHDTVAASFLGIHGVGWALVNQEWPAIKADIDRGMPSPLVLISTPRVDGITSLDFNDALNDSHQVLAYAYQLADDGTVMLWIYDCNDPNNDGSTITFNVTPSSPQQTVPIATSNAGLLLDTTFRALFRAAYAPADPTGILDPPISWSQSAWVAVPAGDRPVNVGQFVANSDQGGINVAAFDSGTGLPWLATENGPGGCSWNDWGSFGNPQQLFGGGAQLTGGRDLHGVNSLFMLDRANTSLPGVLYQASQSVIDGSWGDWAELTPSVIFVNNLAATWNVGGGLDLLGVDQNGVLQRATANFQPDFEPLVPGLALDPFVALTNPDGRLEVIGVSGGHLIDVSQPAVGQPFTSTDFSLIMSPPATVSAVAPAVCANADGRLELFAISDIANLYHLAQTAPGGSWAVFPSPSEAVIPAAVALGLNADGRLELVVLDPFGSIFYQHQHVPGGFTGWTDWQSVPWPAGGAPLPRFTAIALQTDRTGRLALFALDDGGTLWVFAAWTTEAVAQKSLNCVWMAPKLAFGSAGVVDPERGDQLLALKSGHQGLTDLFVYNNATPSVGLMLWSGGEIGTVFQQTGPIFGFGGQGPFNWARGNDVFMAANLISLAIEQLVVVNLDTGATGVLGWDRTMRGLSLSLEWAALGAITANGITIPRSPDDVIVIGDFDGDGADEVLIASRAAGTTGVLKWQNSTLQPIWVQGSPLTGVGDWLRGPRDFFVPADLDGDGFHELLIGNAVDGWLGVLKWNGQAVGHGWALDVTWMTGPPLAGDLVTVADFDGDGSDEVLLANSSGGGAVLKWINMAQGGTMITLATLSGALPGPAFGRFGGGEYFAADIDGDGQVEVLVAGAGDGAITGLLKWNGFTYADWGLDVLWSSPSPISGPAGNWGRGLHDQFVPVFFDQQTPRQQSLVVANPDNGWMGVLRWQ